MCTLQAALSWGMSSSGGCSSSWQDSPSSGAAPGAVVVNETEDCGLNPYIAVAAPLCHCMSFPIDLLPRLLPAHSMLRYFGDFVTWAAVWGVEKSLFTWKNALYFAYAVRVRAGPVWFILAERDMPLDRRDHSCLPFIAPAHACAALYSPPRAGI